MLSFFKKKNNKKKKFNIQLIDFNGVPLKEGDYVMSMRYNMGKCKIHKTEDGYVYESIKTRQKMSWVKMIDAITEYQKVKKIEKEKE